LHRDIVAGKLLTGGDHMATKKGAKKGKKAAKKGKKK
jgi:hypothetical protein